jgi:hypothetical protein
MNFSVTLICWCDEIFLSKYEDFICKIISFLDVSDDLQCFISVNLVCWTGPGPGFSHLVRVRQTGPGPGFSQYSSLTMVLFSVPLIDASSMCIILIGMMAMSGQIALQLFSVPLIDASSMFIILIGNMAMSGHVAKPCHKCCQFNFHQFILVMLFS